MFRQIVQSVPIAREQFDWMFGWRLRFIQYSNRKWSTHNVVNFIDIVSE